MKKSYLRNYETSQELIQNIKLHRAKAVYRKRRITVALAIFAIVGILISGVVLAATPDRVADYVPVTVEYGDSLWSLASAHYPNANKQDAIERIKTVNGLSSSTIYEGDVLMLPQVG